MKTPKHILIGSITLAATVGLTACATADSADDAPPETAPEQEQQTPSTPEGGSNGSDDTGEAPTGTNLDEVVSAAIAALDLAESETGGVAYELSDDDDETQWEIDINDNGNDIEVHVNWAGTEVLRTEADNRVDDDKLSKLDAAEITIQQAITEAVAHATGQLDEAELDEENGAVVWEVSFDDGPTDITVYIDARTGEMLKVDND